MTPKRTRANSRRSAIPQDISTFRRKPLANAISVAVGLASGMGIVANVHAAAPPPMAEEEIVVTGSRIPRANLTAPTAVTTIDSKIIDESGFNNVADVLRTVPSFGVSALSTNNSNFLTAGSGVNTLELRNLDEDRTLVLVNGRRYVSGVSGAAQVDFNTIPTALIDRVEIITGGASAIYGSDALAGVVNVILKKDFEGVDVGYQYGEATEGGDIQNRISLTLGGNFAEDRGNAVFSGTFSEQKGLLSRHRNDTKTDDIATCVLSGVKSDCQKEFQPFFSSFSEFGRFNIISTGQAFTVSDGVGPSGTVSPFSTGTFGFNRQHFRRYSVPTERYLLSSNVDYQLGEASQVFFEGMWAETKTDSELEPFPHSNSDLSIDGISIDNPFVPPAIRAAAVAAGDTDIGYRRRTTEVGQRGAEATRDTYRFVVGFKGDLQDRWNWETYYLFGHMNDDQQGGGQINVLNMREALNAIDEDGDPATFDPICASASARAEGCVPINLFGRGSISREAANYVRAPTSRQQETQQEMVGGTFGGPLFDLPAGPVEFVVGVEYREERSEDIPDVLTQQGLNGGNAEAPTRGDYDVREAFAEVEVPLLKDLTLIKELSIGGAYRWSDYSTVDETDAYTARVSWSPIDSVRFRAQYARAVRAPNINELFAPGGENFEPVADPCDGTTATTPGDIAANCRAIPEIAARIAATGSFTLAQDELQGVGGFTSQGNPDLDVETADTWSYGVVFNDDVGSVGDLTVSVDYFRIEIDDLIDIIDRQTAVDFCFDASAASFPNSFCGNLTRDTTGPVFQLGELEEVNSGFINEGKLETEGVDVSLLLNSTLSDWVEAIPGVASFRMNYTYLIDFTETKFDVEDDLVGETAYAENEAQAAIVYTLGPWNFTWEWTYIDDSVPDNSSDLFNFDVGDYQVHDFQVSFTFADSGWLQGTLAEGARVYFGLNNAFDEDAPTILSGVPGNTTGTDTDADVYDPIGRTWYAGLNIKL